MMWSRSDLDEFLRGVPVGDTVPGCTGTPRNRGEHEQEVGHEMERLHSRAPDPKRQNLAKVISLAGFREAFLRESVGAPEPDAAVAKEAASCLH